MWNLIKGLFKAKKTEPSAPAQGTTPEKTTESAPPASANRGTPVAGAFGTKREITSSRGFTRKRVHFGTMAKYRQVEAKRRSLAGFVA